MNDARKDYIFYLLGITDKDAWKDQTAREVVISLRKSVGWSREELGQRCVPPVNGPTIVTMEFSPHKMAPMISALKPALNVLIQEGWMDGKNCKWINGDALKKKLLAETGLSGTDWENKPIGKI